MSEIGVVQMDIRDGQVEQNLETAIRLISGAPGARLYLLPELFTTGYAYESWPDAGTRHAFVLDTLSRLAGDTGSVICGSFIARESGHLFNRMAAVFPGSKPPVFYDKIHLFGLMKENMHLERGRSCSVFEDGGLAYGMAICYDLRFPSMFQRMASSTDVFLVSSEWPEPRCETMQLMARARAAENQCYLVLSNRRGTGSDGTVFCGHSMVIGPDGSVRADAVKEEGVLRVPLTREEVRAARDFLNVVEDRVEGIDDPPRPG